MAIRVLGDYFEIFRDLGEREALLHDTGYRQRRFSYRWLHERSQAAAAFLGERGCRAGDRLLLWCENRPEWVAAYWACVFSGVQVVPVDSRSSWEFVERICHRVRPCLLLAGEQVRVGDAPCPVVPVRELEVLPPGAAVDVARAGEDDPVQILFTSGTTSEPHGILHTHRNLCAGLNPIQREILKYRRYARPFQPIRMLCLLPLSHVFGQSFSLFIPPLLGGTAVFVDRLNPRSVIDSVRREKVSVVAAVPRMLSGLEEEVRREFGIEDPEPVGSGWWGALRRWIRYWPVHRFLGLKFWSFVVGGAPVPRRQEDFWTALGFAVIQGYGLTESTALVSLNHPFDPVRGSLGRALPGFQVRIAGDGEILIRGPAVAAEWLEMGDAKAGKPPDWLPTGDLGRIDQQGRLYFLGRKKEVIVTAEGLNVFPADVEAVVNRLEGVRQSLVVARPTAGGDEVHAVLILKPGTDPGQVVSAANRNLESHQQIRGWSVWPELDFPRTASTLKVRRAVVSEWVTGSSPGPVTTASGEDPIALLVQRIDRPALPDLKLDQELGLSSLDRIELMSRLEEGLSVQLNEEDFARSRTVADVQRLLSAARRGGEPGSLPGTRYPRWAYTPAVRGIRFLFRELLLLPMLPALLRIQISGREFLEQAQPPLIFAANHASHLDTVVMLAALPREWRSWLAPAMSREHFADYFEGARVPLGRRLRSGLEYGLACGFFGAYPLSRLGGIRRNLEFTGELVDRGFCPLIFPEGLRSPDGRLKEFQSGVGLWAKRLNLPVVPVFIAGTFESFSVHDRRPRRGEIFVDFHAPLDLSGFDEPEAATCALREVIEQMAQRRSPSV